MLDPHGFVATCNSTHFFIVRGEEVWTSSGNYCLAGITRANIIARFAAEHGIASVRAGFQPLRCLLRRRSLRHRHFRRRRPCDRGGRTQHRRRHARTADLTAPGALSWNFSMPSAHATVSGIAPLRIAMWSGPRNISTAMMRAWENRGDTAVWDEPLYAFYLTAPASSTPAPTKSLPPAIRIGAEVVAALDGRRARRQACLLPEAHDPSHARRGGS